MVLPISEVPLLQQPSVTIPGNSSRFYISCPTTNFRLSSPFLLTLSFFKLVVILDNSNTLQEPKVSSLMQTRVVGAQIT